MKTLVTVVISLLIGYSVGYQRNLKRKLKKLKLEIEAEIMERLDTEQDIHISVDEKNLRRSSFSRSPIRFLLNFIFR